MGIPQSTQSMKNAEALAFIFASASVALSLGLFVGIFYGFKV